jgi:hypothetical protein
MNCCTLGSIIVWLRLRFKLKNKSGSKIEKHGNKCIPDFGILLVSEFGILISDF